MYRRECVYRLNWCLFLPCVALVCVAVYRPLLPYILTLGVVPTRQETVEDIVNLQNRLAHLDRAQESLAVANQQLRSKLHHSPIQVIFKP